MAECSRARWLVALLGLVGIALLAGCHADGATFVVDITADTVDADPGDGTCADATGQCSLRAAVMEANVLAGTDVIVLAADTFYPLGISGADEDAAATGDLDITDAVDLRGTRSRIDGGELDRVLDLFGSDVVITGVTLSGGNADRGAGVRINEGTHSLVTSTVEQNLGGAVGGIAVDGGHLIALASTVTGNAGSATGGIEVAGGQLTALDVSISGNLSFAAGTGGVSVQSGSAALTHATVTANSGTVAGGLDAQAPTTITATVIADQTAGPDCAGTTTSGGGNVESATSCGLTGEADQQGASALLEPLADNGGPTLTHRWPHDSAANDAVPADLCTATVDQRAAPRPADGPCDAGAVELSEAELIGADCLPTPTFGPGAQLHGCDLSGLTITGITFDGADLSGANLSRAAITSTTFVGADLSGAVLDRTYLDTVTIVGTDLSGISFEGLVVEGLSGPPAAMPDGWVFRHGRFWYPGVRLRGEFRDYVFSSDWTPPPLDLTGLDLTGADAVGFNFAGADLSGTTLAGADLTHARFCRALDVSNDTNYASLLVGTDFTGADLRYADFTSPDVGPSTCYQEGGDAGVDATGADFAGARMDHARLLDAELRNADLTGANLEWSRLERTDFTGAQLDNATLDFADLDNAVLDGASLIGASYVAVVFDSVSTIGTIWE